MSHPAAASASSGRSPRPLHSAILQGAGPEPALHDLGAALAGCLGLGDVLCLEGDLGAGKTTLARGLIRAAAGDPGLVVPSPTFTLVQGYDTARGAIHHYDLYRLTTPEDLLELGFEESLATAITLVEWPGRGGALIPGGALWLTLAMVPAHPQTRQWRLEGGVPWVARLRALTTQVPAGPRTGPAP